MPRVGCGQCGGIDEKLGMNVLKRTGSFKRIGHHTGQNDNIGSDVHVVVENIKERFEVLGVVVLVGDGHDFQEHHLPGPKKSNARFPGLAGVALFRCGDSEVVEARFQRQMNGAHIAMLKPEHGGELTTNGFA